MILSMCIYPYGNLRELTVGVAFFLPNMPPKVLLLVIIKMIKGIVNIFYGFFLRSARGDCILLHLVNWWETFSLDPKVICQGRSTITNNRVYLIGFEVSIWGHSSWRPF